MKYFAYGSNMSLARLGARCPSAKRLGTYTLANHQLRFHKASADGSGKCDTYYTGDGRDQTVGALFEISETDKQVLDQIEGLGRGYEQKWVDVYDGHGDSIQAVTYYATDLNPELKPYTWYLNHVVIGARESKLPVSYIQTIESTEAIDDPDAERQAAELAVHRC